MKKNHLHPIIIFLIAFIFGVSLFHGERIIIGLIAFGLIGYFLNRLTLRIENLELEINALKKKVSGQAPADAYQEKPVTADPFPQQKAEPIKKPVDQAPTPDKIPHETKKIPPPIPKEAITDYGNVLGDTLIRKIKEFFSTGNVVVKVGVIILFFGIGFLLKYASDHSLLPIELRLSSAGLMGIALLCFGFYLRTRKAAYSKVLQGGGIGVLYLTVFAAAKLYSLLPMSFSFFVMVAIVAFSGVLAVLQNATSLAVFGIIGGFLSPVLMSTGTGSHIALFSYYSLLNIGIFGIAWFKSWRILNFLGFVFTFAISAAWGYEFYQPRYFPTTEPFLVLHFLFYAAISILFAYKQPVRLKGYIDGTLVFGLPVIAFGLQSALVHGYEFGMAYSALITGGFYILLTAGLRKRKIEGMKMLAESFLSLGTIFLSLAIPFALDSGWTSGLWALEGAGILWVGLRQNRPTARIFGILLQLAAAVFFLDTMNGSVKNAPIVNGVFLSCLSISIAGFLTNYFLCIYGWSKNIDQKRHLFLIPLAWGLLWWLGGGLHEIDKFVPYGYRIQAVIVFISLSCLFMSVLSLKGKWKDMGYPVMGLPVAVLLIAAAAFVTGEMPHPSHHWGSVAFLIAVAVQYYTLYRHEKTWNSTLTGYLHRATLYLVIFVLSWEASWLIKQITRPRTVWPDIAWGVVPGVFILLLSRTGRILPWPVRAFEKEYAGEGLIPVVISSGFFILFMCFSPGNPAPLPYFPIIGPVDLAQIFCLLTVLEWSFYIRKKEIKTLLPGIRSIHYGIAALSFFWMNAVIARSVHHWAATRYTLDAMTGSVHFQAGISILWTLVALGTMVIAHKKAWRNIWFTGAGLLAVVVIKLFLVDLYEIGAVARIFSFLVVGGLMLVIGYFSPLPPKKKENLQKESPQ
ncbi:MAG: DUF2339 domain-containing protein [Desulfobacula sp.]